MEMERLIQTTVGPTTSHHDDKPHIVTASSKTNLNYMLDSLHEGTNSILFTQVTSTTSMRSTQEQSTRKNYASLLSLLDHGEIINRKLAQNPVSKVIVQWILSQVLHSKIPPAIRMQMQLLTRLLCKVDTVYKRPCKGVRKHPGPTTPTTNTTNSTPGGGLPNITHHNALQHSANSKSGEAGSASSQSNPGDDGEEPDQPPDPNQNTICSSQRSISKISPIAEYIFDEEFQDQVANVALQADPGQAEQNLRDDS